ncbi:hypothetical protein CYME_CMI260C [Cyanidioschyzon merolae strain 10D]|uniref:Uncharacterized protein n=1 Tax=Cyanidioschyzon merolae (strain NIES-3377 / 10D) TaxID=280699 RepID=M1V7W4_CYAM1|nr:hypothetical protein CYME_CMI260C [Cyanidioschyzon merolae strain 10D]BAM80124.1 hypothetical protein CYME_CMI260C [Cyanidioschyzon merolae strain 10D]|eukprot:XP_005536410.1 hypothetical protein CYME_CMI260C [Cyanidioschyzon merolae strain 10D]
MPTNRFSGTGYRVLIRTAGSSCDTLCRSTFVPGATELDRRRLRLLLIQPRRLIPLRTGLELFAVCTNVCEAGTRQAQQLRRSGKSSGNKWQLGYQLEHQEQGHQLRRPEKHSLSSKPFSLASGRYEKAFKLFELATKKGSMRALFSTNAPLMERRIPRHRPSRMWYPLARIPPVRGFSPRARRKAKTNGLVHVERPASESCAEQGTHAANTLMQPW